MLMLENIKFEPKLLKSLKYALENNKYMHVISNSNPKNDRTELKLTTQQLNECINNFENSSMIFAGINHGNIIKPLFALSHQKGEKMMFINEYLTFGENNKKNMRNSTIENDLTALAVIISIHHPEIKELYFSMIIDEFSNDECYLKKSGNGLILFVKQKLH